MMLPAVRPLIQVDAGDREAVVMGLQAHGVVIVHGIESREMLHSFCAAFGQLRNHPDSDSDGITTIYDRGSTEPGKLAFSSRALALHTDRASEAMPPHLVVVWCETTAEAGGESLFCDARAVYLDLLESASPILAELMSPFLHLPAGCFPLFDRQNGQIVVRYRSDDLVRIVDGGSSAHEIFVQSVAYHTQAKLIPAGSAFVLNNGRVLHGRTGYIGSRNMLRAFVDAVPLTDVPRFGFAPELHDGSPKESRSKS